MAKHTRIIMPALLILALVMSLVGGNLGAKPVEASGVPYSVGDVFAGIGNGQIKHFSPTGGLLDTLNTGTGSLEDSGMTFDLAGNLYSTNFTDNSMSKFDNAGNLIGPFGSGFGGNHPESVVRDAAGNFYVGQADGTHQVLKFSSAGASLASFSPATEDRGTDWIDLSADQCTLLYTSEGNSVKRFNVCTNSQLSDFATGLLGSAAYALRIRPNGEVMVADTDRIVRLNSSGAIIQTYPKPAGETSFLFALNLDSDLTSFWTAGHDTGNVYKFDIATGKLLTSFNAGINTSLAGLTVFGEITAAQPKLILTPVTATKTVGQSMTLTATLINALDLSGKTVTFTVTGPNAQTGTATTDASGVATFTYTGNNAGTDTVVATTSTTLPPANLTSNTSTVTWSKASTTLTYNGATTSDYHDPAVVSATLVNAANSAPISGVSIAFTLDGQAPCTGTTDGTGKASCTITPNEAAGTYNLTASFAGNANFLPSSVIVPFVVTKEETTLAIISSNTLSVGSVVVQAKLLEDGTTPPGPSGQTVTFSATPQGGGPTVTGTGTADAAGVATATLALAPGAYNLTASFAGDSYYLPSNTSTQTIYVFQPTHFVIWGGNPGAPLPNVVVGKEYNFWGSQWAKQVSGGNFTANASFKGFADTVGANTWSTDPGNSASGKPATIASYISVIVSTNISMSGKHINGNIAEVVVLKVDHPAAYQPDPGHPGSGVMVAVVH